MAGAIEETNEFGLPARLSECRRSPNPFDVSFLMFYFNSNLSSLYYPFSELVRAILRYVSQCRKNRCE